MTVSISDMTVPPQKPEMIQKAQDTVDLITKNFKRGSYHRRKKDTKKLLKHGKRPMMS